MRDYRGRKEEILNIIFMDYPDARVVVGTALPVGPSPWLEVPNPLGYVYWCILPKPSGVVVNQKQYDDLEILYAVRHNAPLDYLCNVYDISHRRQVIKCPTI